MSDIKDRLKVSKVNTTPVGLQNLLGNVNQGINPHELDHKIAPIVDLYPHWATRKLQHDFEYNSMGGSGALLATAVPEGQLWQMVGMSFTKTVVAATEDNQLSVGIRPSTGSGNGNYCRLAVESLPNVGYAAGDTFTVAFAFPDRFILSGGWLATGMIEAASNPTWADCWLNLLYIKLTD